MDSRLVFVFLLLAIKSAAAQPVATEHVTVTGTKSREVIAEFVQSFAVPARMTGKLARWMNPVCPKVIGLPPNFMKFIEGRIKTTAVAVGAPVDGSVRCPPNIQIVFSNKPQALLDDIRQKSPDLLGYFDNQSQIDQAALVRYPIQAWYMTQTIDVRGSAQVDSPHHGGGLEIYVSPKLPPLFIPHASAAAVTGSRLGDGLRSGFYHILIVANPDALKAYEMGALGDYIALLALSQPEAQASCRPLPSITNLFSSDCSGTVDTLTANDLGYLKGLYHMSPDLALRTQENEVISQMQQSIR
jgi:hypothetical protein